MSNTTHTTKAKGSWQASIRETPFVIKLCIVHARCFLAWEHSIEMIMHKFKSLNHSIQFHMQTLCAAAPSASSPSSNFPNAVRLFQQAVHVVIRSYTCENLGNHDNRLPPLIYTYFVLISSHYCSPIATCVGNLKLCCTWLWISFCAARRGWRPQAHVSVTSWLHDRSRRCIVA